MQSRSSTPHSTWDRSREASLSRSSGWFHRSQLYRVSSTGGFKRRIRSPRVTCLDNRVLAVMILAIVRRSEGQETECQVHHVAGVVSRRFPCQDPRQGGPQEAPLVHLELDRVAPVHENL